ncbi:MAG: serine/threonine-protein kinase [bacterium]|nr:serine/threonine-protein kinase [bacterium]
MDDLDLGATIKGFSAGQKVFNRYTLKKILGRGGMGVVWLARDDELERDVALKFLPEIVAMDKEAVADLKRETRRSLDLTHPHIIRIHDFVHDVRTAAISMEYVAGASLASLKVDLPAGCYDVTDLREWTRQLCTALDYAHARAKVVHRDLKPANLMIDDQGYLKIADFGIAASTSDSVSRVSAQAGSSGTPLYMSPQQMMGEKPAATDDIYSLGATLYELLTGKPPFYTGNVMMQVQGKVPVSLAARRQELDRKGAPIPLEWEQAIAACLAKEAKDRPQSAGEVAERLGLREAIQPMGTPPVVVAAEPAPVVAGAKPLIAIQQATKPPELPRAGDVARSRIKRAVPLLLLAAALPLVVPLATWWLINFFDPHEVGVPHPGGGYTENFGIHDPNEVSVPIGDFSVANNLGIWRWAYHLSLLAALGLFGLAFRRIAGGLDRPWLVAGVLCLAAIVLGEAFALFVSITRIGEIHGSYTENMGLDAGFSIGVVLMTLFTVGMAATLRKMAPSSRQPSGLRNTLSGVASGAVILAIGCMVDLGCTSTLLWRGSAHSVHFTWVVGGMSAALLLLFGGRLVFQLARDSVTRDAAPMNSGI